MGHITTVQGQALRENRPGCIVARVELAVAKGLYPALECQRGDEALVAAFKDVARKLTIPAVADLAVQVTGRVVG
ncbi:hypothetical protein D3C73_786650 [compost metagenome]